MLYLIKQESKNNIYYKIGYAKNVPERMKAYNNHNAEFELIDLFEGEIKHENILHKHLEEYKVPNRNEWFYNNEKVLQLWNMYKSLYSELSEKFLVQINTLSKECKEVKEQLNIRDELIKLLRDYISETKRVIKKYLEKEEVL